jgi:hypothetical protein
VSEADQPLTKLASFIEDHFEPFPYFYVVPFSALRSEVRTR